MLRVETMESVVGHCLARLICLGNVCIKTDG